jgi:hypothetical protein
MGRVFGIQALAGMLGRLASLNGQKWFSGRRVAGVGCRGVGEERGEAGIFNSSDCASYIVKVS